MRIIQELRKLYPNEKWKYLPAHFTWNSKNYYVVGESHNYDEAKNRHDVHYVMVHKKTLQTINTGIVRFNRRVE